MEKIYMEDSSSSQSSQSFQSSKDYKRQFKISVILSFVVAFFAIYSLIACGISQVSYAAPTDGSSVPEQTFEFGINNVSVIAYTGTLSKNVPIYYGTFASGFGPYERAIFCIEPEASTAHGTTYTVAGEETDAGLLYLLSQFYYEDGTDIEYTGDYTFDFSNPVYVPDGFNFNSLSDSEQAIYVASMRKYFDSFIKQSAVWAYLYTKEGNTTEANKLLNFDKVYVRDNTTTETFIFALANSNDNAVYRAKSKINALVGQALDPSNYAAVNVNLVETESLSKNDDGNYQVGYRIDVPTGADIKGYNITVSGYGINNNDNGNTALTLDSSNSWIVDENGNEIANGAISCATGTSCIDKFTVVISKSVVESSNYTYNFNVDIEATVNGLKGKEFIAADGSNLQKVVSVSGSDYSSTNSKGFTIVTTEDTGMTTAQTIYFIGLVVLLCGIGIVYANAKPAESKQ